MMRLRSKSETDVLLALASLRGEWGAEMAFPFKTIAARASCPPNSVRRPVRALKRKGLAEFYRGLFTEDGEVAGSGYAITDEGYKMAQSIHALGGRND